MSTSVTVRSPPPELVEKIIKTMNTSNQVRSRLKIAAPLIKEASQIVKAITQEARLLLDEKEHEELAAMALNIASDVSVIETNLAQFGRIGVGAKKFAVSARKNEGVC